MSGTVNLLVRTTIKLQEPIAVLAEALARKCDLSVPDLIEALVLGCTFAASESGATDREEPLEDPVPRVPLPPIVRRSGRRRGPAKILSFHDARMRRNLTARPPAASLNDRVAALCRRSRALRQPAQRACLNAEHARRWP